MTTKPYDPTIYHGSAAYYAQGRPPYSRALAATLAAEMGLDDSGRLLDVGCGPGSIAIELADRFEETIGLDPDLDMLTVAVQRARAAGITTIGWVQARAEDIATLTLGTFRLVTFGQSFHWTDRELVAEAVFEILEPGGALALIVHRHEGRLKPPGPGEPPIPHDVIRALIDAELGPRQRAGQGYSAQQVERNEDVLARTRFGNSRSIFCPGRADIVRDIDCILANYWSMSFAAPHLFGERRAQFEATVRAELAARSPSGLFWDWPGDTEIVVAYKPR